MSDLASGNFIRRDVYSLPYQNPPLNTRRITTQVDTGIGLIYMNLFKQLWHMPLISNPEARWKRIRWIQRHVLKPSNPRAPLDRRQDRIEIPHSGRAPNMTIER